MALKIHGTNNIEAGTVQTEILAAGVGGGPKITNVQVTSNSYVVLDDTAVDIAGGYIKITGTGFAAGCQVLINNTPATSTTFIGPTEVRAQLPATAAGTYMLYLINADGGVAIRVNGVTFSATPSWVTASDLSGYSLGDAISIQLSATGASTFALATGSTLPTGLTLSAGGLLSGSVTGLENDTSYSFTITATDAENQDSPRTFTISITVQLQVSRSLRFNSADSAYLSRTPAVAGNRRTHTLSLWFKRSNITTGAIMTLWCTDYSTSGNYGGDVSFNPNTDVLTWYSYESGVLQFELGTTQVFRDTSAWTHLVLAFDSTQATSSERAKIYVNGSLVTALTTATYPTQNAQTEWNSLERHQIGAFYLNGGPIRYFSGYISEVHWIDGQQLTPAAFAETNNSTGQYLPKKYTGTYGTNGFYLPFTDNSSVLNLGRNYEPLTADPFWPQTVLLLNGTGTNNANNNNFIDSSTNAFAITRNGNTTQGTFSPFSQTGWGNYFNGTNAYLLPSSNAAFNFGTGDFTVEAWVYQTVSGTQCVYDSRVSDASSTGFFFGTISTNFAIYTNNTAVISTAMPLNTWTHFAIVRSGSAWTLYKNGASAGTYSSSANLSDANRQIGASTTVTASSANYFTGYISNLRVVKGVAVYTGAFTPPTSPLAATQSSGTNISAITGTQTSLLTCQSNRFIDNSTNNFTITRNGDTSVAAFSPFTPTTAYSAATHGGSAYFDGTGDYLNFTDSANNLDLGGVQASMDVWFYRTSSGSDSDDIIIKRGPGAGWSATDGIEYIVRLTGSTITIYYNTGGSFGTWSTGITYIPFQWNHLCVATNTSNNISVFLNGTTKATSTFSIAKPTTRTTINVGVDSTADANYFTGYVSGMRFLTGSNAFDPTDSSITVPTAPPTAVTGTQLLLNYINAGIVDATGKNVLETVGDAKISTAQSKFGGSSIYFDGNGDGLTVSASASQNIAPGSGNFTAEGWVYIPTLANWFALFSIGDTVNASGICLQVGANGRLVVVNNNQYRIDVSSGAVSAATWTHLAMVRSGTTVTIYVNGVSIASGTFSSTFSGRFDIGSGVWNGTYYPNSVLGYIDDFRYTRAARYTGNFTPPTAQFAYNQGDINYNQWVPTNFSVTAGAGNDSLLDVPTNWGVDTGLGGEVRGNYATLNPINNSGGTFTNGNLDWTTPATDQRMALSSMTVSGISKWYCEFTMGSKTGLYWSVGIFGNSTAWNPRLHYRSDGARWVDSTQQAGNWSSFTQNDIIGIAFDGPTGTATFYKNGVSQGTMTVTDLTVLQYFGCTSDGSGGTMNYTANFGQRPFAYAAPAGFKCMNTHNLPALAVTKSNTAFDAKVFTGNGTSLTVSEFEFAPDLVWIKGRSTAYSHYLFDTIRGATKMLYSESTSQEDTGATSLTAFTSNGFTVGTNIGVNNNATSHIAWAWDAGTTTVVNTAGTITANVRVNQSSGCSVVAFTTSSTSGTVTVGHGLGVAPNMIILKDRSYTYNWDVYHAGIANCQDGRLLLNLTDAYSTTNKPWASVAPTSTVFSFNQTFYARSGDNIVAYCFAAVPGFSAFGTYTGNGSADGPFVYTGFRPKFILLKSSTVAATNWQINDTARDTYNVANKRLAASAADAEATNFNFGDILSNGFKIRQTDQTWNSNGQTYIYAAFAESPFKYARAR